MCTGGGGAPDTSAQEAEARRQREVDEARAKEQRDIEERRHRELLDEQRRIADAQAAAAQAENERQFKLQQDLENRRQEEAAAELARQEQERAKAEAEAAARAQRARDYSAGRTQRVDQVQRDINTAFGGFDDRYYGDFVQNFLAYYNPQLDQQYKDAVQALTFRLADRGRLTSGSGANDFGDLAEKLAGARSKVSMDAANSAQTLRGSVDAQRQALLAQALSATNIGPDVLPEGVTDVNQELSNLSARLTPFVSNARTAAGGISAPSLTPLSNVFGTIDAGTGLSPATGGSDILPDSYSLAAALGNARSPSSRIVR